MIIDEGSTFQFESDLDELQTNFSDWNYSDDKTMILQSLKRIKSWIKILEGNIELGI